MALKSLVGKIARGLGWGDQGPGGRQLRDGIGVLVCCKDEEYSLDLCLRSVLTFADQIVCVDNGSSDKTREVMGRHAKAAARAAVEVVDAPRATLCEARNLGLARLDRKWLLNCGGDFVFQTDGELEASALMRRLTATDRFVAYRFGHVNLMGDLEHTVAEGDVYALGEYYLLRFGRGVLFQEARRFDYLRVPAFYQRAEVEGPVFFHLSALKSDERLLYRNIYFDWREAIHRATTTTERQLLQRFGDFREAWVRELFGTSDPLSVMYRFQRQAADLLYSPYAPDRHHPYPAIVRRLVDANHQRFRVTYRDGRPHLRTDSECMDLARYAPTGEDETWDTAAFGRRFASHDYLADVLKELERRQRSTGSEETTDD